MNRANAKIVNEQVNDVPLLLGIMEEMGIRRHIDEEVTSHGNWQGISVGTAVEIWLSYVLTEQDHRLVGVRTWANERRETLNGLLGVHLRETDLSDDRLGIVVGQLGQERVQVQLDRVLMEDWLSVYELPRETVRLDSTSVSVYGEGEDEDSLLQRGHSQDHRPDLAQFKVMLSTLDPLGLPLSCEVLSGEQADDGLYVPAYERMVGCLGRRDVLVVGDSKMAALATRGHLVSQGSAYLCSYRPVGHSHDLDDWLEHALAHQVDWQAVTATDERTGEIQAVAMVYVCERLQAWTSPTSQQATTWAERVLLVRCEALRDGLIQKAKQRLAQLGQALDELCLPPAKGRRRYRTRQALQAKVESLLDHYHLRDLVQVKVREQPLSDGSARWIVEAFHLDQNAWNAYLERLGWHIYLTNTTAQHYDVPALLWAYRHQVFHERGFSRLKTRRLHIRPVYLRDEQRIAGLTWLLCLALRVLTLTEFRIRAQLHSRQEALLGLNPAVPSQTTTRPTTERVLQTFRNLTLTILHADAHVQRFMSDLSPAQRHILALLDLPLDLYSRLTRAPPFPFLSLPES
jgi:transposase